MEPELTMRTRLRLLVPAAVAALAGAVLPAAPAAMAAGTGPCDIYASGGTPCVAAHSTVRALFGSYNGNLYQVRRSSDNTEFLRTLYSRLTNQDLKEKVLFSLSQQRGAGNEQWLMNIAVNSKEDIELRKKALFWAGQSGVAIPELAQLYDRMGDTEMKEQIIFVLSQRQSDRAAIDKMFDIAKNEKEPELRKKAIFWLGQSRDPRVQQFLIDLINR